MKKFLLPVILLFAFNFCVAQQQDIEQLHETAKTFMRQGDYSNAILVLNRGIQADPNNIALIKDLALSYYFQKDNAKAIEVIKPVLERDDADDQCFQIAGGAYKQLDQWKEGEKLYRKGIRKFPSSGALYNELGELLFAQADREAIDQWEKGIEVDPSYSKNYYNAARYYYKANERIWTVLYGEIFINMEPSSRNSPEIKDILLESYKKIFERADLEQNNKEKNAFVKMFLQNLNKQTSVAGIGINTESLTMIRTRFILEWARNQKRGFPFKLFEYQQQLLQEGLFNAYNQWIFGSSENLAGFQAWTMAHKEEYNAFLNFQKSRTWKFPEGQYYH